MSTLNANPPPLRDIKALRPAPIFPWRAALAWGLAALLVIVTLWLAWRFVQSRKRAKERASHVRPAQVVALEALAALHRIDFADAQAIQNYYFAISEVLRTYVEARFALNAAQLTTEEIFARLPTLVELTPADSVGLRRFLANTDPVKYARHQPTPEDIATVYKEAVAFIEVTAQVKPPTTLATQFAPPPPASTAQSASPASPESHTRRGPT